MPDACRDVAASVVVALTLAAATAAPALASSSAQAASTLSTAGGAGGALPDPVRSLLPQGTLAGAGRMTWLGFHLYDARLFAPADFAVERWDEHPLALELTYARNIAGSRIAKTTVDELERLGVGDALLRAEWLDALTRLFPDVDKGHRLTGAHLPGRGVRFFADDRPLGSIEDATFARGFFAIWLDSRTRAPQLRASLVGAARGAPAR